MELFSLRLDTILKIENLQLYQEYNPSKTIDFNIVSVLIYLGLEAVEYYFSIHFYLIKFQLNNDNG